MTMPGPTPDPYDRVRDAFDSLGTSEKAAFVLEATFSTIGQALAETGRRAAQTIDALNIDAWFTAPPETHGAPHATPEPPPMAATPADIKKTAARPDAPDEAPGDTPPKTAGKPPRRPPADDES